MVQIELKNSIGFEYRKTANYSLKTLRNMETKINAHYLGGIMYDLDIVKGWLSNLKTAVENGNDSYNIGGALDSSFHRLNHDAELLKEMLYKFYRQK